MKRNSFPLLIFFLICAGLLPKYTFAWSDPILVTSDSSVSRHSRAVFDRDGNIHFFFTSDRHQEVIYIDQWDVFHCKFSPHGDKLTDDLRLDTTHSSWETYPSPVLGIDEKLHVAWSDIQCNSWRDSSGIYYARMDTNCSIEREATRLFDDDSPSWAYLFQDSQGNMNVVWVHHYEILYYAKFDTSCQVLIPPTPVYVPLGTVNIWYLNACIDNLDQIHCVYKNYYGTWDEFNLGYSCVNTEGDVLIEYAALTPESPEFSCPGGQIVTDENNDLHVLYMMRLNGESHQFYRKMDQNLNTIYDIMVVDEALSGYQIGSGDITIDSYGNVVMAFVFNYMGIELHFKRATYSINGTELIPPETIVQGDDIIGYPDLATYSDGAVLFNFTGPAYGNPYAQILYSYTVDMLPVEPVDPASNISKFELYTAYPNPFNPTTTLSYNLSEQSKVSLKVYNLHGQLVATLVDGWRNAGYHEVTVDAAGLVSGVYIYRLQVADYTTTGKMILLK